MPVRHFFRQIELRRWRGWGPIFGGLKLSILFHWTRLSDCLKIREWRQCAMTYADKLINIYKPRSPFNWNFLFIMQLFAKGLCYQLCALFESLKAWGRCYYHNFQLFCPPINGVFTQKKTMLLSHFAKTRSSLSQKRLLFRGNILKVTTSVPRSIFFFYQ
jgi:hypothetical protein